MTLHNAPLRIIAKSSAHSLLHTLASRTYVERSADGHHFRLGPQAFEFANLSLDEEELRRVAHPHLERLTTALNLATVLAVRRGRQGVLIDNQIVCGWSNGAWIGMHFHLHASAMGKVLIAYLSDAELERLFLGHPLIRVTPNTTASFAALKAQLADVRACGFAVNNEEDNVGAKAVAAPIFNHVQGILAAVCALGPTAQIPDWHITTLAEKVTSAAADISRELAM